MDQKKGSLFILRLTLAICAAALCTVCVGMAVPSPQTDAAVSALTQRIPEALPMEAPASDPAADHRLTDEELELLARVISAEARGESYDGQVAVGAVILNRMEHPDFPDSLEAVCLQHGAFDGVSNGQIRISPSRSCVLAAADAASGRDPTGGAVFFYNPDTARDSWIRSREVVAVIGSHCFCV